MTPRNEIIVGDARAELIRLAPASVDMVLTSPPYFNLRDYGVAGQLGAEGHIEEWVVALRGVARELRRVLTPTGSFWLNVADSYATHGRQGAGRKSLLLGPERLAVALVDDGWLLRNKIIWSKTNPVPSSVRDRLSCTWEAIYVFVKQPRYFFDLDGIRLPHRTPAPTASRAVARQREAWRGSNASDTRGLSAVKAAGRVGHPLGKNPGDVWRLPAGGYRGAHHATFPVALAERAIRAGCPEAVCTTCRAPWQRRTLRATDGTATRRTLGPTCRCGTPSTPGLVLDPFFGAGTTGVAAEMLGRDWLGIELNPHFAALARTRLSSADKRRVV